MIVRMDIFVQPARAPLVSFPVKLVPIVTHLRQIAKLIVLLVQLAPTVQKELRSHILVQKGIIANKALPGNMTFHVPPEHTTHSQVKLRQVRVRPVHKEVTVVKVHLSPLHVLQEPSMEVLVVP
jgi:hypothetical protein